MPNGVPLGGKLRRSHHAESDDRGEIHYLLLSISPARRRFPTVTLLYTRFQGRSRSDPFEASGSAVCLETRPPAAVTSVALHHGAPPSVRCVGVLTFRASTFRTRSVLPRTPPGARSQQPCTIVLRRSPRRAPISCARRSAPRSKMPLEKMLRTEQCSKHLPHQYKIPGVLAACPRSAWHCLPRP